jgi:hypothetical protein
MADGLAPIMVVVLHLIVWDGDSGTQLGDEYTKEFTKVPGAFIELNLIEVCRLKGLDLAREAVWRWRRVKPNAFANVDCQWERKQDDV